MGRLLRCGAVVLTLLVLSGCRTAQPDAAAARGTGSAEARVGLASYYANWFEGRRTASGERFDNDAMVAAHPTYPFDTRLRVTNLRNGRAVTVRVVDRGPAPRVRRQGVIIDLSRAAAQRLDFIEAGRTRVRVERTGGP